MERKNKISPQEVAKLNPFGKKASIDQVLEPILRDEILTFPKEARNQLIDQGFTIMTLEGKSVREMMKIMHISNAIHKQPEETDLLNEKNLIKHEVAFPQIPYEYGEIEGKPFLRTRP